MIVVKEGDVDIGAYKLGAGKPAELTMKEETRPPRKWRRLSRPVLRRSTTLSTPCDCNPPNSTRRLAFERHSRQRQADPLQSYLTYLKGYMKAVKTHLQEKNPERVAAFEKGAQAFAKKIVGNFKDYEFYVGESMNPDGMVALLVSLIAMRQRPS
jgi:hypothetical protein